MENDGYVSIINAFSPYLTYIYIYIYVLQFSGRGQYLGATFDSVSLEITQISIARQSRRRNFGRPCPITVSFPTLEYATVEETRS